MKDRKQLAIEINESTLWAAPKSDRGKHPDFAKIKNDILYYLESLSNFFYDEYEVSFSELCYPMFEGKNNEISPIIQCMLSYDPKKTKFFIKFFSFQMHQLAKRIVIQKILQQEYIGEVTEKESDEIQNIRRDVDKLRVITS